MSTLSGDAYLLTLANKLFKQGEQVGLCRTRLGNLRVFIFRGKEEVVVFARPPLTGRPPSSWASPRKDIYDPKLYTILHSPEEFAEILKEEHS